VDSSSCLKYLRWSPEPPSETFGVTLAKRYFPPGVVDVSGD